MLTVEWLESALEDMTNIVDYISQYNPIAADGMKMLFRETAESIPEQPYSGRRGRKAGTREKIPHPRYVMVYRVTSSKIEIVNIIHTSTLYP